MKGPRGIIWIITAKCNLRCKHCYSVIYEREKELDGSAVLRVLRDAADAGVKFVNFTGGEPLVRKDLFTILSEARELGIDISIFSNLTLLKDEDAEKLYRLEVPVYTSMDGPTKEVHERLRGRGSWKPFLRGLKMLINRGVDVHVNIAVSRYNWMYVTETVKKAFELGINSVSLIPTMKVGRAVKTKTYVSKNIFLEVLKKVVEEVLDVSIWCAPFAGLIDKSFSSWSCKGWNVMDISPSGRFILCDVMNYEVANVVRSGIMGAWRAMFEDPVYQKVIDTPKECTNCQIVDVCRGGCYARTWPELGKDPLCPK